MFVLRWIVAMLLLLERGYSIPLRACALGAAAIHTLRQRRCEAVERRTSKKKTMRLHDIKRDESQGNEYYAGGIDDQGHGSGTVLLYPRDEYANTTSTGDNSNTTAVDTVVNATSKAEMKAAHFKGQARSLK